MKTETKANHTQGPWIVEDKPFYAAQIADKGIYAKTDDGGYAVAVVLAPESLLSISQDELLENELEEDKAELSANARLIAAAPDLLYNLKRMVACLGEHLKKEVEKSRTNLDYLCPCPCLSELQQAQTVISKAEGGD